MVPRRQPAHAGSRRTCSPRRTRSTDARRTLSVAERQQYLTIAVRDFLNEGGKLALAGETAAYYGQLGQCARRIYYGLDGAPDQDCVVTTDFFSDCLLLADDFTQYWLGAYDRTPVGADGVTGTAAPLDGRRCALRRTGDRATIPIDEVGQFTVDERRAAGGRVPAVRELGGRASTRTRPDRSSPSRASTRCSPRTSTTATSDCLARTRCRSSHLAPRPRSMLRFSYSTELGYDHVIVEARAVGHGGLDDAPRPERRLPSRRPPIECEAGFLVEEHPQLAQLPHRSQTRALPTGDNGRVELVHRLVGRMDPGVVRPQRVSPVRRWKSSSAT